MQIDIHEQGEGKKMEKQIKEETKKKSIYIYTKKHNLICAEKHDLMYKI